jgi:hypothetical protein
VRVRERDSYIFTVFHTHTLPPPPLFSALAPLLMCVVVRESMNVNMREDIMRVELLVRSNV